MTSNKNKIDNIADQAWESLANGIVAMLENSEKNFYRKRDGKLKKSFHPNRKLVQRFLDDKSMSLGDMLEAFIAVAINTGSPFKMEFCSDNYEQYNEHRSVQIIGEEVHAEDTAFAEGETQPEKNPKNLDEKEIKHIVRDVTRKFMGGRFVRDSTVLDDVLEVDDQHILAEQLNTELGADIFEVLINADRTPPFGDYSIEEVADIAIDALIN